MTTFIGVFDTELKSITRVNVDKINRYYVSQDKIYIQIDNYTIKTDLGFTDFENLLIPEGIGEWQHIAETNEFADINIISYRD